MMHLFTTTFRINDNIIKLELFLILDKNIVGGGHVFMKTIYNLR